MTVVLPLSYRTVLGEHDVMCAIAHVGAEAAIIAKLPGADIEGFRDVLVMYQYAVGLYPEGAVLALGLTFMDSAEPFSMETFMNVAIQEDVALARMLTHQRYLTVHLFDEKIEYRYSKRLRHRIAQRFELVGLITTAVEHVAGLAEIDWAAARARFMEEVALGGERAFPRKAENGGELET